MKMYFICKTSVYLRFFCMLPFKFANFGKYGLNSPGCCHRSSSLYLLAAKSSELRKSLA